MRETEKSCILYICFVCVCVCVCVLVSNVRSWFLYSLENVGRARRLADLRCSSFAWLLSSRETLGGYAVEEMLRSISRLPRERQARSVLSRCDGHEILLQRKRLANSRAMTMTMTMTMTIQGSSVESTRIDRSALRPASISLFTLSSRHSCSSLVPLIFLIERI